MAASKSTPKRSVQRVNRPSVPQSGGAANARKSVARSDARTRTAAKAQKGTQEVLPAVQPPLPQARTPQRGGDHSAYPSSRYPEVDPKVLLSSFARAEKGGAPDNVSWDASRQQWIVPSATDPRRHYRVWRRQGRSGPLPFYVALECNCIAEQSGSYIVCWHKCAVKLWLNEWFSKRSFGQQLEELEELEEDALPPPDDDDE